MKKLISYPSISFILIILLISCVTDKNDHFYPENNGSLSEGQFSNYKSKLDTAYLNDDDFNAGIQLSNLKAPSEEVFKKIFKGIKKDSENCYKIYEWHKIFVEDNFQTNLVKSDTVKFKQVYTVCKEMLGEGAFIEYQIQKEIKYQERLSKLTKLDTAQFDLDLIKELQQMHKDDQRYRNLMYKKGITAEEKKELWKKQHLLDSINLEKAEKILLSGYPPKEKIGYDNLSTIWLIMHHQGDYATREKFLPFLKDAVKEGKLNKGLLETFEWRNENIRLSSKE